MNSKRVRVIQSWDDGVMDDLRLTALLRRHGAAATFNLNPGLHQPHRCFGWKYGEKEVWRLGQNELSAVYAGFSIANHSLHHPNLPDLPMAELVREVEDSRRLLQAWFQQPVPGFCYPFGTWNPTVKDAVRAAGHSYARTVNQTETVFPPTDPFELGVSCRFHDPDFWERYEQTKRNNGVFCFWGHSYELLDEAMWAELEHKIAAISADPAARWTTLEALFDEGEG